MNIADQVIIISAERSDCGAVENDQRTRILKGCVTDINLPFSEALGVYKGKEEISLVVLVKNQHDIDALKGFAFKNFDQESILYTDANSEAYLFFNDGKTEQLGRLLQVPKEQAIKQDNFTILNDEYYITIPRNANK